MKYLALMEFGALLHGKAKDKAGTDKLRYSGYSPLIEGDKVKNMPSKEEGITYVVNALVFNHLKGTRSDIIAFDPSLAKRDSKGLIISQGGFNYP